MKKKNSFMIISGCFGTWEWTSHSFLCLNKFYEDTNRIKNDFGRIQISFLSGVSIHK